MQRAASIFLFILGGFCVGMQVMVAFFGNPPGAAPPTLPPLVPFAGLAALFLAPAAWLSPGQRWRELGIAILAGAGVCAGSFAITLTATEAEGGVGDITPLQPYLDWTQGFANLAVVAIAGLSLLVFGKRWRVT